MKAVIIEGGEDKKNQVVFTLGWTSWNPLFGTVATNNTKTKVTGFVRFMPKLEDQSSEQRTVFCRAINNMENTKGYATSCGFWWYTREVASTELMVNEKVYVQDHKPYDNI
ncbi:hypothetical protein QE152_g5861 [Popillia japonica]|uniref:Uncharacterized protein n=1 Tax=Popillia japonica TaxID=7064 RepID=A0AAW1ML43_POPJA